MNKAIQYRKRISLQLDKIIKQRKELQVICDELDELYDKESNSNIGRQLTAVQGCIDLLKDAEKELSNS